MIISVVIFAIFNHRCEANEDKNLQSWQELKYEMKFLRLILLFYWTESTKNFFFAVEFKKRQTSQTVNYTGLIHLWTQKVVTSKLVFAKITFVCGDGSDNFWSDLSFPIWQTVNWKNLKTRWKNSLRFYLMKFDHFYIPRTTSGSYEHTTNDLNFTLNFSVLIC